MAAAIPAFSLLGGQARSILVAGIGPGALGLGLSGALGLLLAGAAGWYPGAHGRLEAVHLAWLAPIAAVFWWAEPQAAVQVHLILFGTFGFLSVRCFGLARGLLVAALVAGLDELLQLGLAYRVGEWRDVGLNAGAAAVGGWLARHRSAAVAVTTRA